MMLKSLLLVSGLATSAVSASVCGSLLPLEQKYTTVLDNIHNIQANASKPNAADKKISSSAFSSHVLPRVQGLQNGADSIKGASHVKGSDVLQGALGNLTASLDQLGAFLDKTIPAVASSAVAATIPAPSSLPGGEVSKKTTLALNKFSSSVAASKSRVDALKESSCSAQNTKRDDIDHILKELIDELDDLVDQLVAEIEGIDDSLDEFLDEVIAEVLDLVDYLEEVLEGLLGIN